ncbi:MAG: FAD-dependent oxidoreductase [Propionibacteriales bacterium]|nr:FAD-dependent oxidoreductase [Propionibacteriales bacterium]
MTTTPSPRVAVVGAGPAGLYAADGLVKAIPDAHVDVIERLPAPYGLIRYGVAPDHPRIKSVTATLAAMLAQPRVRLVAGVEVGDGADLTIDDLRRCYDAIVLATGALRDRALPIPGADLVGSFSGASFVSWFDAHPDAPAEWPLDAESVAVVGAGNVALDIARILARSPEELAGTEMPDEVLEALAASRVRDVHVFGRRGPAQAKFSPLEVRELGEATGFDVIVDPADLLFDDASFAARASSKMTDKVVGMLEGYAAAPPQGRPKRLHLHFLADPVEVLGEDGRVVGLRTARAELDGVGGIRRTGEVTDWPVQAVYSAIGYRSDAIDGLPFDPDRAVVPAEDGRVVGAPGVYATGWIRRGPVGLIGQTRSDAAEVVAGVAEDLASGTAATPPRPDVADLLDERGVTWLTWQDWCAVDEHERRLGAQRGRERTKVAAADAMVAIAHAARAGAPA